MFNTVSYASSIALGSWGPVQELFVDCFSSLTAGAYFGRTQEKDFFI
jgi:hypothetical protein